MAAAQKLPAPTDRQACAHVVDAIERWKKYLYPDLPGEPVTPEEFLDLTKEFIAWRDRYAPHIEIEPLAKFQEIFLQCRRGAAGLQSAWKPTESAMQAAAHQAVNVCERLKNWLQRTVEESSQCQPAKRGRKPQYDAKVDERVHDAWKSGQHAGYEDLARSLGLNWTRRKVARAIDRHRHKQKRR